MSQFKLLIFTFLCASSFELSAATRPFRLGEILSAEISREKVVIKNLDTFDYDFGFTHYAYAVVAVKLQKGRSLSIYDFKLKFEDKAYECVAIRSGNEIFDAKCWQLPKTLPTTVYSLLFILNSDILGNAKKTLSATLVYNLAKNGPVNYKLPFKFINYDKLTEVNAIPGEGVFEKVKIETKNKVSGKPKK